MVKKRVGSEHLLTQSDIILYRSSKLYKFDLTLQDNIEFLYSIY